MAAREAADKGDTVCFKCSESVITCQICMETFESPRILPCQHTFCKDCVVSLLKKHCLDETGNTKATSFPCPNCRRDCKIRQKEKHSIDEHLKCFPESLLLKTLLDSIHDNCREDGMKEGSRKEYTCISDRQVGNESDDGIYLTRYETNLLQERLWFYCLFMIKLKIFLADIEGSSFRKVNQSTLIIFLQSLLDVPRMTVMDEDMYLYHCSEYFDIPTNIDTAIDMIRITERQVLSHIPDVIQNDYGNAPNAFSDAQTQTESCHEVVSYCERLVVALLIKNMFPVVCLFNRLCQNGGSFEMNLFNLTIFRTFRIWTFLMKLFDIFSVMYIAGHSFSWSLMLLVVLYVILLVSFKKIKTFIDGGLAMTTTMPVWPLFLISLNCFANVNRWYAYLTAVCKLEYWLLIKLALLEAVPQLFLIMSSILGIVLFIFILFRGRNADARNEND